MYKVKTVEDAIVFVLGKITSGDYKRILLVSPTEKEAREIAFRIVNGRDTISFPEYHAAKMSVTFPEGAEIRLMGAREWHRLRGVQSDLAWAHDVAGWENLDAWEMLLLGARLGPNPIVLESYE